MGMIDYIRAPSRARLIRGDVPHWVKNSARGSYIASVILSAPPWVDIAALKALKAECQLITALTGIEHVLDHIVPLNHPNVCGLTVPWNIQIIPRAVNATKSNKWAPDQIEMEFAL